MGQLIWTTQPNEDFPDYSNKLAHVHARGILFFSLWRLDEDDQVVQRTLKGFRPVPDSTEDEYEELGSRDYDTHEEIRQAVQRLHDGDTTNLTDILTPVTG